VKFRCWLTPAALEVDSKCRVERRELLDRSGARASRRAAAAEAIETSRVANDMWRDDIERKYRFYDVIISVDVVKPS
jgi:hypothetical protein